MPIVPPSNKTEPPYDTELKKTTSAQTNEANNTKVLSDQTVTTYIANQNQ